MPQDNSDVVFAAPPKGVSPVDTSDVVFAEAPSGVKAVKGSGWVGYNPSKAVTTKYGFSYSPGEAPTGGGALIREDNAINFPGQDHWLFYDPASKQYAPAPSEPWKNKGFLSRNFGADALTENARNFDIGTTRAVNAGLALAQKAIPASWQPADQAQTDQAAQQYQAQQTAAVNNTQQDSAKKYQTFGQMAPATALAGFGGGLAASSALFGAGSAVSEPGDLTHRTITGVEQGGLAYLGGKTLEKVAVPLAQTGANYLVAKFPWLGNAAKSTIEFLNKALPKDAELPTSVSDTPWADAYRRTKSANATTTKYLDDLEASGTTQTPSEIKAGTKPPSPTIVSAENAVEGIKKQIVKNVEDLPFATGDIPKIAADPTHPLHDKAVAILDAAQDAARGGDPTRILSSEADMGLLKKKLAANAIRDIRDAKAVGLQGPMTHTAQAIDDRINFLKADISTDHSAEIAGLEKFKAKALGPQSTDSLGLIQSGDAPVVIRNGVPPETSGPPPLVSDNGTRPVVGGGGSEEVRDAYGTVIKPATAPAPTTQGPAPATPPAQPHPEFGQGPSAPAPYPTPSYANGLAARSTLKEDIRAAYAGKNTYTGTNDVPTLLKITKAIDADHEAMALASGKPDVVALAKKYNEMYTDYSRVATDRDIIRLAKNDDPDGLRRFLGSVGPADAQKFLDLAGPKGQAAYAQIAVENAFGKAFNARTNTMYPGNVSAGVNNSQDLLQTVIKDPALKAKIDSMTRVFEGLARGNPANASAFGDRIMASGMAAIDRTGLTSLVTDKATRGKFIDWAFNTPQGKDFLFRMRGVSPDSTMFTKVLEQDAPKIKAAMATSEQK